MKSPTFLFLVLATLWGGPVHAGSVDVGGIYSVPAVSLKEGRYLATERQQFDFSCGSAALSTLLTHHYGHRVNEQAVFEAMYRHGDQAKIQREGFSLLDMKRFLESHGYQADGFEAPLDKLESARIPAIALINESGYNHFVVIKGVRDGRVLIGDPAGGTRALARAAFEARWVNQIVFVITNKQELAGFNLAADWRTVPRAPTSNGILREGLNGITIPKLGPSDF
ncbi:C39 family peptidase [Rhizobacter sp. Root1221]|uniref:C39 family peptidase n=1 Tax=Rhizobacter sp. Root1221 TaxID=1736433 RepID=UPI0006F95FC6|nr:C39 family peptidase [Rhizobacter sp. Root1221]KQV90145.1 peptidase C39 [Rhizobacter sp. Root1221]